VSHTGSLVSDTVSETSFIEATAKATGQTPRNISAMAFRGKRIGDDDSDAVTGTNLDKFSRLALVGEGNIVPPTQTREVHAESPGVSTLSSVRRMPPAPENSEQRLGQKNRPRNPF
jgi:hypothetical protein